MQPVRIVVCGMQAGMGVFALPFSPTAPYRSDVWSTKLDGRLLMRLQALEIA